MLRTLTWIDPRLRIGVVVLVALAILPLAWYLGSPLFLNQTVNEALPSASAAQVGQATTGAAALHTGQFNAIDGLHKGEGTASIYRQPDGNFVLRLDSLKVTNGPDLYVYLSGHPAPTDAAQLHQRGAMEVARLKGNIGSQNYELPADVDISQFRSVVIYCKQFSVIFTTAELNAGSTGTRLGRTLRQAIRAASQSAFSWLGQSLIGLRQEPFACATSAVSQRRMLCAE